MLIFLSLFKQMDYCLFQVVIDQALTERHMGLFQGMKIDDVLKTDAYKSYSSNNDRNEELPVRQQLTSILFQSPTLSYLK